MTDQFFNQMFRVSVAAITQKLGWDAAQTSAIDILADVWKRQLLQIGKTAHRYAEHYGRSEVNSSDIALAFKDMNLSIPELEEYVQNFDPVRLPFQIPKYPVAKTSNLNFLRPGSKEMLSRPVHIHEYMPPWEAPEENGLEKEDRKQSNSFPTSPPSVIPSGSDIMPVKNIKVEDLDAVSIVGSIVKVLKTEVNKESMDPELSVIASVVKTEPKEEETTEPEPLAPDPIFRTFASATKRGSSATENPALKRVRILIQEEGHPFREVSSVMMTTSGFLSCNREGRLPESRPPPNRDFFDPEPVVEKKKKSVTMKKIVEGVKKIEKETSDDLELFGKPDRLVQHVLKHKPDSSRKSKERESSKSKEREETPTRRHSDKESKTDKLKIFKKKSRDTERHAKHDRPEIKLEIKMEQDLEQISSDEGSFVEEMQVKPISITSVEHVYERRKSKVEEVRKEKKRERERRPVPGVIPIPRISPKIITEIPTRSPAAPTREKKLKPVLPPFSFTNEVSTKQTKLKKRHLADVKSLIPEITINVSKSVLPPVPDLKPFFGNAVSMAPGLVPTNLVPPPPLRFGGSSLSPSITITPAAPAIPSTKERKSVSSGVPIPSTVCSSVTITRIDMPNSQEHKYESPPHTVAAGKQSPIAVHHPDSTSGITITPILMTGDHKPERASATVTLLDEGQAKEQRRKEKEKRKEIKKEKKKEKREKLREQERLQEKVLVEKQRRKESVREMEPIVPKLTLKLPQSNVSTPVDSPNTVRTSGSDRTETPPPKKITIKPIEDLVTNRTPSPELARFSPLVTRPPKIPKVAIPKQSPPIVAAALPVTQVEKSLERRQSKSKPKSKPSSSSQSGLVTETVGFYIDEHGTKVWICPAAGCGREDDGSPMIGCDLCDDWYHFVCAGIEETPDENDNWYCPRCIRKGATRKGR